MADSQGRLGQDAGEDVTIRWWQDGRDAFSGLVDLSLAAWGDGDDDALSILCESYVISHYLANTAMGFVACHGDDVVGACLIGPVTCGRLHVDSGWRQREEALGDVLSSLSWMDSSPGATLADLAEEAAFSQETIRSPYPTDAEVMLLVVHPDWQGRGIGKRLLSCACEVARRRRWRAMFLITDTHCDWHFYDAIGCRRVLTRPGAHDAGVLRMAYLVMPDTLSECDDMP